MVGPTTRLALKNRALSAVSWLDVWIERLQDEMKKQNIELFPQQNLRDLTGDSMMTMTLKRGEVRDLILGMRQHRADLARFAK